MGEVELEEVERLEAEVQKGGVVTLSSSFGCLSSSLSATASFFVPRIPPKTATSIRLTASKVIKNKNHNIGMPQTCLSLNRLGSASTG